MDIRQESPPFKLSVGGLQVLVGVVCRSKPIPTSYRYLVLVDRTDEVETNIEEDPYDIDKVPI